MGTTWGDPNPGHLGVIPIWVKSGPSRFGSTQDDPNLGQLGGDPDLDHLGVIPIWVYLVLLRFGSTWGDPNLGQLGVIRILVNLG